jgi:hypothetical protein
LAGSVSPASHNRQIRGGTLAVLATVAVIGTTIGAWKATNPSQAQAAGGGGLGPIVPRLVAGPVFDTDRISHTITLTSAINPGETAVVISGQSTYDKGTGCTNSITGMSDTGGNTWTQDIRNPGDPANTRGFDTEAWSAYMPNGMPVGGVITQQADTCHTSPVWVVYALNLGYAPNQADRLAGAAQNTAGFTDTPAMPPFGGTFTPTAGNAYVFMVFKGSHNTAPFWTPGAGWNELIDYGNASTCTESGCSIAIEGQLQGQSATAVTGTGTAAASETWSEIAVAYKKGAAQANVWVDTNGGSCTRTSNLSPYSDSAACGSTDAAWDLSQPGDVIMIKGGTSSPTIYTQAFTLTGNKTGTVTVAVPDNESAWFTGDGSISTNNVLVYDSRPVKLTPPFGDLATLVSNNNVGAGLAFANMAFSGSNIHLQNVDEYCDNNGSYTIYGAPSGGVPYCSASFFISNTDNLLWEGGALGPQSACNSAGCPSNTDFQSKIRENSTNITFKNDLWHDMVRRDPASGSNGSHTQEIKVDNGDNINLINNAWISCECNSAVVFFGANGTVGTANHILVQGNVFAAATGSGGGPSFWYAYGCSAGSACDNSNPGIALTITFKYNTAQSSMNARPSTGSITSGSVVTYTGNFGWRQNFQGCTDPGGVYTKNTWFVFDAGPVASCTGDNAGIVNFNVSTGFTSPGAPNYNYELPNGSPAISAGGTGCSGLTDLEGHSRPITTCDVGAIER